MKKTVLLMITALVLVLDGKTAAAAASSALELCIRTLIPSLFPLFVVSAMLVPQMGAIRIPWLCRFLGFPAGSEGLFLLGCAGGFPVGAACVSQAARNGSLKKRDAERMLGLVSFCGPSFLFGVIAPMQGMKPALLLFLIQLESALMMSHIHSGRSDGSFKGTAEALSLTEAVRRSVNSMATVCAWVTLASIAAGFAGAWIFRFLPEQVGILLTGLMELTNGVFALQGQSKQLQFLLSSVFISFGGVSVLLQIGALAESAGLSMKTCIMQKALQALLAAVLAAAYLTWGPMALLLPFFVKTALAIPGAMVYNVPRKEGI